ncbi:uncharacterized protein LOC142335503 isoform X2 [Convolutriloba macropyga]|uniref:uncharacterized protein LOC142335503 isoform X2 n=1 Tax=Convolutriloba macropyga TaxID=536237 RepID=UPI003F520930
MSTDVQHHFAPPNVPNSGGFNNAAKLALLQQSVLRNRVPPGPIFTNTGLTPEELLAAKKPFTRKSVDYNASMINMIENRIWQRDYRDRPLMQADPGYIPLMTPTMDYPENAANAVATKFVRTAMNKMKCPVFSITWTPNGRRLLTGSSSGEFTLWNGLQFNFETILQAHDAPIRAMTWSNTGLWLLSGDHNGFIKYWQTNMNNVKMFQAHREVIRDICFAPTDNKFASCSDDATVRIWDFFSGAEERVLRGHGADCKTIHWHPTKCLLVSGSKDAQQPMKMWDPKSGRSLNTLFPHKAAVTCCRFSPDGNWLASGSRDHVIKLFDIRNMKQEMNTLRGHKREVLCLNWHPLYGHMLVSGGGDGSILYWDISLDKQVGGVENAHDGIIWDIKWHPLGHIVASASNDFATKFWTRNNPGDRMRDKYNLNLDEELETEELVANQEPDPRAVNNINNENAEVEYQEVDTTIPALNPEETARIPKERRKRYMPPQFTIDAFGVGEKIRRGDKRIDPRFKIMWNSYQRPDLLREEYEDHNVPTYDGGDLPIYDRNEPILNNEAPPPWQSNSRRNPLANRGFRDRDDYDDRSRDRDRDFDRFRDRDDRFYDRRFGDGGGGRDHDDRRDRDRDRDRDSYNNGYSRSGDRDYNVDQRHDEVPSYRDFDFRGQQQQQQPPADRRYPPGGDIDYRNSNGGPPPPRMPNDIRGPGPHRDSYGDRPPHPHQASRFPGPAPNGNGPMYRQPIVNPLHPNNRPGAVRPPRGQSGKGGLNWYS